MMSCPPPAVTESTPGPSTATAITATARARGHKSLLCHVPSVVSGGPGALVPPCGPESCVQTCCCTVARAAHHRATTTSRTERRTAAAVSHRPEGLRRQNAGNSGEPFATWRSERPGLGSDQDISSGADGTRLHDPACRAVGRSSCGIRASVLARDSAGWTHVGGIRHTVSSLGARARRGQVMEDLAVAYMSSQSCADSKLQPSDPWSRTGSGWRCGLQTWRARLVRRK